MKKSVFPSDENKFRLVLNKNTFFFHDDEFEEKWEAYISSQTQSLLVLKNEIESKGPKREVFIDFVLNSEDSINILLTLIGFSKEMFLRLVTFIRIYKDESLNKLVNRDSWPDGDYDSEWSLSKITQLAKGDRNIAEGIINVFFEGSTLPALRKALPLFEYKKLDINKLEFKIESIIDTIVRYKAKGTYSALKENNPEITIEKILEKLKIQYTRGNLNGVRRTMDFIIPNKEKPEIVIESSYVVTTSSGMGDKAKTEMTVAEEIRKNYPKATFFGFVDGIGWYVRQGDLKRIVSAFSDVFTFEKDELIRFEKFLTNNLSENCYKKDE